MTRDELRNRITTRELQAWRLLEDIDPWGERREDVRAALICAVIANVNRGKDQKPYPIGDFLLDKMLFPEAPRVMSADETISAIAEINRALGGRDLRKESGDK